MRWHVLPDGRVCTTIIFVGGDWNEGMNCSHHWGRTGVPFGDGGLFVMESCRHCTASRVVSVDPMSMEDLANVQD